MSLSFWVARNLTLSARDRLALFVVDNALLRLYMEVRDIARVCILEWSDENVSRFSDSSESARSPFRKACCAAARAPRRSRGVSTCSPCRATACTPTTPTSVRTGSRPAAEAPGGV